MSQGRVTGPTELLRGVASTHTRSEVAVVSWKNLRLLAKECGV